MFKNALSNFALWAKIFVSALKGARAIQNFDLIELKRSWIELQAKLDSHC